jgi:hypothetical protein
MHADRRAAPRTWQPDWLVLQPAAATLVVALPLSWLFWLSGTVPLHVAAAAMVLFVLIVQSAGSLLSRAALASDMGAPAAWVLGIFATAMAVYGLAASFQLLASTAFAIWATVVVALGFVFRRHAGAGRPMQGNELVALLVCGAATVLWCRRVAAAPEVLAHQHVLTAWIDYFIHGGVISYFGDPLARQQQSIDLVGFAAPFYHNASFHLPAVFAAPLDLPGLPLATSVWLPLGFFTMCAGAYVLGAALAGPAGGVAAVAVLTLVPDASNYGLRNGFFSFHWNVVSVPGATYAIGLALLSIALLERWSTSRSVRPLLAGGCLAAGLLVFRAHVFGLAFPVWLASAAALTSLVRRRKLVFLGVTAASFVLFLVGFYTLTDFLPALELFLDNMHDQQAPTAYEGWYTGLLESYGRGVAVPAGMLLIFPAALGIFVLLYPVSAFLAHRFGGLRGIDVVPAALVVGYVLVMIAAPIPQHHDATELTHRPFVLLYAVIAIWTVAAPVKLLAARGVPHLWRALLLASAVALPLVWSQTDTLGELPKFDWGQQYYAYTVDEGLPQAATFLRHRSRPGDVIAVEGLASGWVATDVASQLSSMTGIPAYVSRPFIQAGRRQEAALKRYLELKSVAAEESEPAALARLRELGVSWYVVVGQEGPRWDRGRDHAAFGAGEVAVYSTRGSPR